MTEKLSKYQKILREKFEHIKGGEKDASEGAPVKIRLRSDSDKLLHSSPIRCEGHPTTGNAKGEFKWYRMNTNVNTKMDNDSNNDNFQLLCITNTPVFYPNMEDSVSEIACQWVPDKTFVLLYQPSNFGRIGPLSKDPTILKDAQTMIDTNVANFQVKLSDPGSHQYSKLLTVDCKHATINVTEAKKNEEQDQKQHQQEQEQHHQEQEQHQTEIDDTSSHYSPSLSSRASSGINRLPKIPQDSPADTQKNKLDDWNGLDNGHSNTNANANANTNTNTNTNTNDVHEEKVEEKKQKQTEHDKTSVNNEVHNPSTPQLTPTPTPTPTPDLHDIQKQTQTKEKEKDKEKSDILISKNKTVIKIKSSFQIQMSRNNTQEMTIVRKSTTNRSSTGTFTMKVVLKFYLQTARERDVLYTVLNALITKKKRNGRRPK